MVDIVVVPKNLIVDDWGMVIVLPTLKALSLRDSHLQVAASGTTGTRAPPAPMALSCAILKAIAIATKIGYKDVYKQYMYIYIIIYMYTHVNIILHRYNSLYVSICFLIIEVAI